MAFWRIVIQSLSIPSDTYKAPLSNHAEQQSLNAKTGRIERIFVNLEAVYPNPNDSTEEYSFDELRAKHRGWLDREWDAQESSNTAQDEGEQNEDGTVDDSAEASLIQSTQQSLDADDDVEDGIILGASKAKEENREGRNGRIRKKRVMEIRVETQTSELDN